MFLYVREKGDKLSIDLMMIAFVDGFSYAGLLFLVSLGLTFIFGVMGILNIAHGAFYSYGGYAASAVVAYVFLKTQSPVLLLLSLFLVAIVVGAILGSIFELTLVKRALKYDPILKLLLTFGAFLILEDLQKIIWGTQPYSASQVVGSFGNIELGDITYTTYQLVIVPATAFISYLALVFFLRKTPLGKQVVAITHDREVASTLGINAKKIAFVTFLIGAVLGVLGGALASPTTALVPGAGAEMIVLSFAVVATAGLGQITGALIAALMIGVARSFAIYLMPEVEVAVPYIIMVLVLLIRPNGLFTVAETRKI